MTLLSRLSNHVHWPLLAACVFLVACTAATPNAAKETLGEKADNASWGSTVADECSDECAYAGDGECDDGRPGADYSLCAPGSDCQDCGAWAGWECAPTGVVCSPECANGEIPGTGVPCQLGEWDSVECSCVAVEECAPTGVACLSECTEGVIPGSGGAPCMRGTLNADTCECEAGAMECPATGVACVPECIDGMLPDSSVPCVRGDYNEETCACDEIEGGDTCPATGVVCAEECIDGQLPGSGVPCTRGTFSTETCECVPTEECAPSGLACLLECVDGLIPGTSAPCQLGMWNDASCMCESTCNNTCRFANDGECDDGSEGSDYSLCPLGTDCADCS